METEPTPSTEPIPITGPILSTEPIPNSGATPCIGQIPSTGSTTTTVPMPSAEPTNPTELTTSASKRKQLSRDQRLQIHTLRRAGHTVEFIVDFFKPEKVTYRQVYYACTQPIESQKHRCGAKPKLDETTRHRIKELITQSTGARPMTYREVAKELQLDVSENTIARALAKEGWSLDVVRSMTLIRIGYHHTDHHRVSKNSAKRNDRERQKLVKQVDLASSQTAPSDRIPSPNAHTSVDMTTSWASSPDNSTGSDGTQPTEPSLMDPSAQIAYDMSSDPCESRHW